MRLGWRNPRPNDFQGPDQRPLRDLFGSLHQFLNWPYAGVTIDGTHTTSYVAKTLAAINAPSGFNVHNLVRANTIQAPQDFEHWLAIGTAGVFLENTGTGRYLMGWLHNGAVLNDNIGEVHVAHALSVRVMCPFMRPVQKGDTLSIAVAGPAAGAGDIVEGEAWVMFLPLG